MDNIDKIMEMLHSNNDPKIQEAGLELAGNMKDIHYFVQPMNYMSKAVWENCARALKHKTDQELEPFIIPLLEWLQDINWPGAFIIYYRLKEIPCDMIINQYKYCIMRALEQKNNEWLSYLAGLIEDKEIYKQLTPKECNLMIRYNKRFWRVKLK